MDKSRNKIIIITLLIIFSLASMVGGVVLAKLNGQNFSLDKHETYEISSYKQLNELGDAFYNDTIKLKSDILITNSSYSICPNSDRPFEGVFDGCGHTIYLKYSNSYNGTGLFGNISEKAVIKNTNFIIEKLDVKTNVYGCITTINKGTIMDCSITGCNINISNSGYYSPVTAINYGTIKNVYINSKLTTSASVTQNIMDGTYYGNVAATNYGTIQNVFVRCDYSEVNCTNQVLIGMSETYNKHISSHCSNQYGELINCVRINEPTDNWVLSDDSTFGLIIKSKKELFVGTIFTDYDFDINKWELNIEEDICLIKENN